MQAAQLHRRYVGSFQLEFTQRAKVGERIEQVCALEIGSVQPSVRDRAELADEVIALHVTDEAVRVGETEMQTVAERRQ